ncbi:MAG TPA: hypothetical protein VGS11_08880 [Candidatus Bathyarchaeia archaeon]|nr:hypothetical protein [Candidatus Bathyarchaeia archaeon]
MPVKIIHPDHIEIMGLGRVLLTAPPATSSDADLHMGSIVEEAALTSRSHAVIGKVNREFLDPNRIQSVQTELRRSIEEFITEDGIRYILEIQGKREPGVDIRTVAAQTSSDSTIELVRARLVNDFNVGANPENKSDKHTGTDTSHGKKNADDNLSSVEQIQIQFGHEERHFLREKVIRDISEIADILNGQLAS